MVEEGMFLGSQRWRVEADVDQPQEQLDDVQKLRVHRIWNHRVVIFIRARTNVYFTKSSATMHMHRGCGKWSSAKPVVTRSGRRRTPPKTNRWSVPTFEFAAFEIVVWGLYSQRIDVGTLAWIMGPENRKLWREIFLARHLGKGLKNTDLPLIDNHSGQISQKRFLCFHTKFVDFASSRNPPKKCCSWREHQCQKSECRYAFALGYAFDILATIWCVRASVISTS